ncbi:unnamed protein product [Gadus morhua 'NCC']
MATCDSPPMVSSQQQEHGGQKLDAAAEDNSVIAMETGFAHSSNNANNAHRSSPVVAAVIGESENGLGDPALSPLKDHPHPNCHHHPPPLGAGKDIPCNECSGSFSSLQKYMEHHCPSARLPTAGVRGEAEDEADGALARRARARTPPTAPPSSWRDSKEQRGDQGGSRDSAFQRPSVPPGLPQSPGRQRAEQLSPIGERSEKSAAPMSFYPQIINTFHIASSLGGKPRRLTTPPSQIPQLGGWWGAGPVLHSFRVYDLRHKSDKDYLMAMAQPKSPVCPKMSPTMWTCPNLRAASLTGGGKPVLMCFLCKLSFGYSRSFVTHAVHGPPA